MNNLILIVGLLFSTTLVFGQITSKAENLGLVSELVYMKLISENEAIRIMNDSMISTNEKIIFVKHYNNTKVIIDQVLIQLIADCKKKNSIKYFRKLDDLLVEKTIGEINEIDLNNQKGKSYIKNLKRIKMNFDELILKSVAIPRVPIVVSQQEFFGFLPATPSTEELVGVLSFITSTIKNIKDRKEKKVEKITQILDELRLKPLQELVKKEKKEEKKEEKK